MNLTPFVAQASVSLGTAGQLGDFVGGYVGTAFALLSVLLLYVNLKSQRISAQLQSFEAKYFQLLKLHRENVGELELQEASGRKIFVLLTREFREILTITREVAKTCEQNLSQSELLYVAYYCLFYGVGPNSSRMLKISLKTFDAPFIALLEERLDNPGTKRDVKSRRNLGYVPFEGHQSRLGHYYRHLYQTVCYVHNQPITLDKYEYVKTIRAQLSTHEQALLLLNSLTPIGQVWWKKNLINEYRMVQNLPRDFFDPESEIDLKNLFQPGYFEWEEA